MSTGNVAYDFWNAYVDEAEGMPYESPPEDDELPDVTADVFERQVEALAAELLDSAGLDSIPALEPLVDGFLYRDTVARIIGASGHMKSFVVLDIAAHIGAGLEWRGRRVTQGLVIYLVAEGSGGLRKRVRAWEQHHQRRMENVRFLPRPVQARDGAAWAVLLETCRRLGPVLVIFDTQARITVGVEENSATEMGRVVERIENLRGATQACVALVHHKGLKGEQGRGSTAVKGALQTELTVVKEGKREQARVIVQSDKQKDDEEAEDVVFAVEIVKLDGEAKEDGTPVTSVVLVPAEAVRREPLPSKRPPATRKILEALEAAEAPLTAVRIVDWIAEKYNHGLTRETVSKALNGLAVEGVVDRIEETKGGPVFWLLTRRSEEV